MSNSASIWAWICIGCLIFNAVLTFAGTRGRIDGFGWLFAAVLFYLHEMRP